jgi:hypothetical protein
MQVHRVVGLRRAPIGLSAFLERKKARSFKIIKARLFLNNV